MTVHAFRQFAPIVDNYPLDLTRGWLDVLVPSGKTNLCAAPSFERGNSNGSQPYAGVWQFSADVTARVVAETQTQGARSLRVFVDDPLPLVGASTQATLVSGRRYTFSFDFRNTPSDHLFQIRIAAGTTAAPSTPSSIITWKEIAPTSVWKRYSLSFVAPTSGTHSFAIVKYNAGLDLEAFWIDAVQIEEGEETTYFDGDSRSLILTEPEGDLFQPQFYWTGEPHASPSVRTQYTRAGGDPINLQDYGWLTKAIVGLGTPPFLPIGTPYAMTGGSEFNRVLPQERTFSLVGRLCAENYLDLSRKRQALQSLFAPVLLARSQPVILRYQPTDECGEAIGCPILIESVYTDGLTGNITNRNQEELSINFKSFSPFVRSGASQGDTLVRSRAFPFVTTRFATGKWTDVVYNSSINSFGIGDIIWGLDGAIYMAQYTSNTNLAIKRLAVGATTWTTLDNITVGSASIKNVRMTFGRDWKLWITGINFFPADATKRVGWIDARSAGTITWNTPASIGGYGVDIKAGYRGEIYLVTQPTAGSASRVYRYDNFSTPLGWKLFGETDQLAFGIDVARDGRVYLTGRFTDIDNFDASTTTVLGGIATTNGDVDYVWEALEEGLTGTGAVGYDVAIAPDGSVYFAGDFDGADTTPVTDSPNLVKWNGTNFESVISAGGMDGEIRRVYIAPDGSIYIFGTFTQVEGVEVDFSAVYKRGRWQPLSVNGSYSGVTNGSPIMMGINPQSGDYVLARNITGSPLLPAYTSVYADMTAPSKPVLRVKGEGVLYNIVNHTSQSDIYFGSGFQVYDQETIIIDLSNLRPRIISDVRGDVSQFVSPDSRLGSWRIQPGINEIEVLYVNPSPASGWGGELDIYWEAHHISIDAAINCNFDALPLNLTGRADDEGLVPEDEIEITIILDEDCFELDWEDVEDTLYYEVEWSLDGETWEFLGITEDSEFVYCPDEAPEVDPYFRVRAVYGDVVGAWHEQQYVPASPPAAPTNLVLATTGTNNADVLLTWDDNSTDETGFIVERSYNNADWVELTTTAANIETYTDSALDRTQTTIYYRVRAENGEGESANTTANIAGWKVNVTFYVNLNEVSGNRTTTVSGMTLIDNNTVPSVAGKVSNAASFVAANDEYLNAADNAAVNIGGGDFSISAWIQRVTGAGGAYQIAIGKDNYPSTREWGLFAANGDTSFHLFLFDNTDSTVGDVASAGVSNDTWYHVVVTRSGSDLFMYINNGTPTTATITGTPRSSSAVDFTISAPNSTSASFGGYVDEVAIAVGRAWSAGQIAALYNAGNGTTY